MFESKEDAAVAALLSMLLEVSGTPKAGNVDREHDFTDLKYEHFLASASSAFPTFLDATQHGAVGELILKAVKNSMRWHRAQNVHFGAFLLLIPLLKAWDASDAEEAGKKATMALKKTSFEDSLNLLKAFRISQARVMDAKALNLHSEETEKQIKDERINLYEWMELAPQENVIAKELTSGYELSVWNSKRILENFEKSGNINYSVVVSYHFLLSKVKDPLIISKFGDAVAEGVRERTVQILKELTQDPDKDIHILRKFDENLVRKGINPGSVADLTISSIYLALLEGLRF
ncbi:MAG: triphosphoribosyl-dephospho-CoA synthase [Archaeoglobus sp.]|nr:triphosphoribosyl-dephospho-CoA synthase [Archaeoglobus sp.]